MSGRKSWHMFIENYSFNICND